MFFIFSKLVGIVIASPLCYCFILLIVAFRVKVKKIKTYCIAACLVIFFLGSNQFVFDAVLKSWVSPYLNSWNKTKVYRYGIVLGGFASYNQDTRRIEFNDAADRWIDGILLYKQGHIQQLVIASDGSITSNNNEGNPEMMRNYMIAFGVAPNDIIFETEALNTRENATLTLPLLGKEVKSEQCLLITSAVHMHRSVNCFEQAGISPDTYITDMEAGIKRTWKDWVPNFRLFSEWQKLIHEWIGIITYKIMGY